jgi:Zn-dependent protease with chaperone function
MSYNKDKSIAFRSFLAVLLFVGFYILGLGIAAALLYVPFIDIGGGSFHVRADFFCVIGAFIIVISLVPRRNKFEQPGPLLQEAEHPRLFAEIRKVAELTGQVMPKEVYLISQVNAWVSQYGGFLGFKTKRIMGLGLTLLQILDISELRAILAHEFGHYYGGDTKLAPLVYRTRSTIERTLSGLSNHSSMLQKPFQVYGNLFLRVTHSVSRAQEFAADKLAVSIAGSEKFISGLTKIHAASEAFDPYWKNELAPVLSSGFLPPVADGFRMFIKAQKISDGLAEKIQSELENPISNKYDTHPPFKNRIDSVKDIHTIVQDNANNVMAITLMENVQFVEKQLLIFIADKKSVESLKPIEWNEAAEKVYIPYWEAVMQGQTIGLKDITPLDIPKVARDVSSFAEGLKINKNEQISHAALANKVIGSALAFILHNKGWSVETFPGESVYFKHDGLSMDPFNVLTDLSSGKLTEADWDEICRNAGIENINIGRVAVGGFQRDEEFEA